MRIVEIIIPSKSTVRDITQQDIDDAMEYVENRFIDAFGGCQAFPGVGAWKDDNGNIVRENIVRVVSAPGDGITNSYAQVVVAAAARWVARYLEQDTVFIGYSWLDRPLFIRQV